MSKCPQRITVVKKRLDTPLDLTYIELGHGIMLGLGAHSTQSRLTDFESVIHATKMKKKNLLVHANSKMVVFVCPDARTSDNIAHNNCLQVLQRPIYQCKQ